jgi:hypothetical protein
MSSLNEIRDLVANAKASIARIEELLGGDGVVVTPPPPADSLTDTLSETGVWSPSWLEDINAPIKAKNPTGYVIADTIGPDGNPTSRTPLVLVGGFYFDRCLQRTDLIERQRDEIQAKTQWAWAASFAMVDDVVTGLPRLPVYMHDYVPAPGAYTLSVPAGWYKTDSDLRRALRRMYEIHLGHVL